MIDAWGRGRKWRVGREWGTGNGEWGVTNGEFSIAVSGFQSRPVRYATALVTEKRMSISSRPNIILIMTDQQSATMMSCAGNSYLSTPAIDRIAGRGMRFERAYCSNPVCLPSRFSMMTGRLPSEIDVITNDVSHLDAVPDHVKRTGMGWLLRDAGYETVYAGRYHLPHMTPEDLGFEYIENDERDILGHTCADFVRGDHAKPFMMVASFIGPHDICYMAIRDHAATGEGEITIDSERVELRTLDRAMARPAGVTEGEFLQKHCPPLPPNFKVQEGEPGAIEILQNRRPFKRHARETYGETQWRMHRWAYCRLTEMVDAQLAPIVDALYENDQAENTVVIFTSDHGDMDSAHRMEHKNALYEQSCRVPFIVSQIGAANACGVDTEHLVSNGLDLLPTICDYAGAEVPEDVKGMSVRGLVEGREFVSWRNTLPVEGEYGRMVMTSRYKYMMHFDGEEREQLMDLQEDPGEMRNALNDPGNEDIVEEHRGLFAELFPE